MPVAAATKSVTKVYRPAEIAALAADVKKITTGWIGNDKIPRRAPGHHGRLRLRRLSVVELYESTASTDARTL
jgi:hypothetical protein